jgi:nucleoid-associated protein YgaU
MAVYTYIVKGDMTWTQISYAVYGKANLFPGIIVANPDVSITPFVANGVALQVPILETVAVQTDKERLPPWKQ